jgi:dTDP-4-amino-4,6-dideoxygalactose transaminase
MRSELALHGGAKTAREPFPPWPLFSERTLTDILEPLKPGRVASWSGNRTADFEARWAEWIGAPFAVSCSSCTAALHMALLALGVGPGDEVIVPSHTFVSTSLAVVHAGAVPVFCDVSLDQTMDPHAIEALVTPRTRALIAVHLYGIVCDMERIAHAARRTGIVVIEDCAQSAGGELAGRKTGALADVGCFSFSQGKHVSSGGEGGMVVTTDEQIARTCRSLRDYGREQEGPGRAAHVRMGFNYRLTEMQAIVGINELARLDSWNLQRRRGYAKIYDHAFSQLYGVLSLPLNTPERRNAYWKYPLQLDLEKLSCGIDEIRSALAAEGVPDAGSLWPESYDEPVFAELSTRRCPTAETIRQRTIIVPLPPTWEKSHVEICAAAVKKVLRVYRR